MRINQSRVKAWRKCRRSYWYKYGEGLRRKLTKRPFKFGTLIHRMGEFYNDGLPVSRAIKELPDAERLLIAYHQEEYGHLLEDALDIMRSYERHWKNSKLKFRSYQGSRAEFTIEAELTRTITGVGTIDFLGRTRDARDWLGDRKTYKRPWSGDAMWRNVQSAWYHRLWESNGGKPLDGTLWDFIYSKPPTRPQLKKDGDLSARQVKTLPETLKRVCRENDLDVSDYPDLMEIAKATRSDYFHREYVPRDKAVEKSILADFIHSAREIEKSAGKDKTRTIDYGCDHCEYALLCRAKLLKLDYGFVKRREYVVDETQIDQLEEDKEADE